MVIDHNHVFYRRRWSLAGNARYNGAYYYSQEIVNNIIPEIKTDRNWVTINVPGACTDHSIVFIHNNLDPKLYDWLKDYKDLVLICGIPETCENLQHFGKTVYLPLSVDIKFVQKFKAKKKTEEVAFAGRSDKKTKAIPKNTPCIEDINRYDFLTEMAKYKQIYAVGRTAIEAKVLGCEVLPYDERFPDPEIWTVYDNSEVIKILQKALDDIDKPKKKKEKTDGKDGQ